MGHPHSQGLSVFSDSKRSEILCCAFVADAVVVDEFSSILEHATVGAGGVVLIRVCGLEMGEGILRCLILGISIGRVHGVVGMI